MNDEVIDTVRVLLDLRRLGASLAILAGVGVLLFLLRRLTAGLAERFPRRRLLILSAFPVLRLGLWLAAATFVIFAVLQPSLNAVLALSATVGVAVGFGAQDLVRNVLAGVLILAERPFSAGDLIEVDGHRGEVLSIGLRSVRLRTFDDSTVSLPNSLLINNPVSNSNSGELHELVAVEVTLPASVDTHAVADLAYEAALCSPYCYRKKPVTVLVEDRYDLVPLTVFRVKAYVVDVRFEKALASDIVARLKEEVAARGLVPGAAADFTAAPATAG